MKPGNLFFKVPNPAATKDEDSIKAHRVLRCAYFFVKGTYENGKKTVYL